MSQPVDLDWVLEHEAGQLGRYQLRTIAMLAVGIMLGGWAATEYLFTTARINHRCLIPECESPGDGTLFTPAWLGNAVPGGAGGGDAFESCQRYNATAGGAPAEGPANGTCPAALFDPLAQVPCDQYVYETTGSIVYEFGLACDEWRRALVGSLGTAGIMVAMPVVGMVSDRWGRRTMLTIAFFNTAWLGLLRCLATTYNGFLIAKIIESILGTGGYTCAFILTLEMLGPKYRLIAGAMMNSFHALGQAGVALLAWALPQWRMFMVAVYTPQLLTLAYLWLLPESMRWLMSKGRVDEALDGLQRVARVNGRQVSAKSLELLRRHAEEDRRNREAAARAQGGGGPSLAVAVWRCRPVLLRVLVAPVWWVAFTLVYYGLTINSVNISGNSYVNFAAVSLVEVPGFWLAFLLMGRLGRKPVLVSGFLVCAACQLAYLLLPDGAEGAALAAYLVGKAAIALVVSGTYVYTAELFPTRHRHSLFAYCSMVGRLGAIAAPLTPALGPRVPFALFGAMALLAGALMLLTPETRGRHLPDTMEEAAATATAQDQAKPQ